MDMGQGVDTAIAQFIADELDVVFTRINVIMGDTELTLNQGGASSATGIERGSIPLRNAAAEAPITYWQLIGDKRFNIRLQSSGNGNSLNAWGEATVKTPKQFKVVGTSVPRTDIPPKVFGDYLYIDKVSIPGMWHGLRRGRCAQRFCHALDGLTKTPLHPRAVRQLWHPHGILWL